MCIILKMMVRDKNKSQLFVYSKLYVYLECLLEDKFVYLIAIVSNVFVKRQIGTFKKQTSNIFILCSFML